MTTRWSDERVQWLIPFRRCAIKGRIPYADLIECWIDALAHPACQSVCNRWYGTIASEDYSGARASVDDWRGRFFGAAQPVPLERIGGNRLNQQGPYYARLWKGPLRVLLELEQLPSPATDEPPAVVTPEVAPNTRTETPCNGGALVLRLNERKEIVNPDADLLPGDVIEFPLFKFLAACNLSDYATLAFNGAGSFFLGTSVCRESDGATGDGLPQLHENMTAMRFQLLLNLALGAFTALDREVFSTGYARRPRAAVAGHSLTARGMIYAGSLGKPTLQSDRWAVQTNQWGVAARGLPAARNVASRAGIDNLPRDLPVTPGWSCSPSTVFLSHYIFNLHVNDTYGLGSVHTTMNYRPPPPNPRRRRQPPDSLALQDANVYEAVDADQLEDAFSEQIEQGLDCIQTLQDEIDAVIEAIDQVAPNGVASGQAADDWQELTQGRRRAVEARSSNPDNLYRYVGGQIQALDDEITRADRDISSARSRLENPDLAAGARSRTETRLADHRRNRESAELQRSVLIEIRDNVDSGVQGIDERLGAMLTGDCWQQIFESVERRAESGRLNRLKTWLQQKRQRLQRFRRGGGGLPLQGLSSVIGDFSEVLTDVTVLSNNGHEVGMVKIYRHDRLGGSNDRPRAGFIAAYNPFTGASYFTATDNAHIERHGQLYFFESTGSLRVWRPATQELREQHGIWKNFGAKPFRWQIVPDNRLKIGQHDRQLRIVLPAQRPNSVKPFMEFWRIRAGDRTLEQTHDTLDGWLPVMIKTATSGANARPAQTNAENLEQMYAERAVPFPTLDEVLGGYISWEQMNDARVAHANHVASLGGTAYANALRGGI